MLTNTERLYFVFKREFLNNILIMHPLVRQYEDILKFEDADQWFEYENLPPSIEMKIKEYWKDTFFGTTPYYLDPEFFEIIPGALFNSLRFNYFLLFGDTDLIISETLFKNFKEVISEAMGGYYGLVNYDENDNIIPNEEANQWADEEGNYHLDGDNQEWEVNLRPHSEITNFIRNFSKIASDPIETVYIERGDEFLSFERQLILYNKRLLKCINLNVINEQLNGCLELYRNNSYFNQQHIKIPPFTPKVFLSTLIDPIESLFHYDELVHFSDSIPAGIDLHNGNNRFYFPQDFLEDERGLEIEDCQYALKFECKYSSNELINQSRPFSIMSKLSEYKCLTKEIILDLPRISFLSMRYGYDYEDFCQAVLCKNLGFWLTQDLCVYPTQWFLRIDMEFIHFYSDYFANMLCENESQKNILALLALFGTKEHQSYYRTPVDVLSNSNFTLSIIDHLPSLKTDWNPQMYRSGLIKEDYEPDRMEAYQHELLKSYIPIDESQNQFPEDFYLDKVIETYRGSAL